MVCPDRSHLHGDQVVELVAAVRGGGEPEPAPCRDLLDRVLERGGRLVRRSTATSWRSTSSSAFLEAAERLSSTSQPQTRMKMEQTEGHG